MGVLKELEQACPAGARRAEPGDAVDGVAAELVVTPRNTEEVAAALRVAGHYGLRVVARGAGTKLDWGNPPTAAELLVDLGLMDEVIEHVSDDLVARVKAGTSLAHLSEVLGKENQRLPIDEVVAGSTAGGVVSTGLSGPSRFLHGAVRDLVLGMTVVRADGVIAHAGSKVVKNVAGYDLSKLFTGSFGTLGVLTELTFKLKPVPVARCFVVASYPRAEDLAVALSCVLASQAAPSAIEVQRVHTEAPFELSVLIEGRARPTELRAAAVASLLGASSGSDSSGASATICPGPPPGWGQLPGPVTLKLTALLSAVPAVVEQASGLARHHGLAAAVNGSAGSGVLFMGVSDDTTPEVLTEFLSGLREICRGSGGHAVVLRAPARLKSAIDIWGPVPGIELMRRVKERFDPGRRLAPGRFVGAI
jgi:glycolate oxidase FAD binding subunit